MVQPDALLSQSKEKDLENNTLGTFNEYTSYQSYNLNPGDVSFNGDRRLAFNVACWVYEQNLAGIKTPRITMEVISVLKHAPQHYDMKRRISRYLNQAVRKAEGETSRQFYYRDTDLRVASHSFEDNEVRDIAYYLMSKGYLKDCGTGQASVTIEGMMINDQWDAERTGVQQGYAVLSCDDGDDGLYTDGICKGVLAAGYTPLRADDKKQGEWADDQALADIRRSAFIIADFSRQSETVSFRAGFAQGLGKVVIYTCNRDSLEDLSLRLWHENIIIWDHPEDAAPQLEKRILARFGPCSLHI